MNLHTASWVVPVDSPPLRDGAVLIRDGRIEEVGPAPDLLNRISETARVQEWPGCALLPGLVNAHSHLEYTVWAGTLAGLPYWKWIQSLVRSKFEVMDNDALLDSARKGALEMLSAGVTSTGEQTARDVSIQAMRETGLAGIVFLECFGRTPETAEALLGELPRRLEEARAGIGPGVRLGLTPHTPWTSGPELIRGVARIAREQELALSIHADESPEESRFLLEGKGALAEAWQEEGAPWRPPGTGAVGYLDRLGFWSGPRPVQAVHLVQAGGPAWRILGERHASVALCPRSNAALQVGPCPVGRALASGLPVGLGTDSKASAESLSPWDEAREARRQAEETGIALESATLLEWITSGAAESLGLLEDRGTLTAGKRADLALFPLRDPGRHDPVDQLLDGASSPRARATFVKGRAVLREGRPGPGLPWTEHALDARCRERIQALRTYMEEDR